MSELTPERLAEILQSPVVDYTDSWVDLDRDSAHYVRTIGLDGRWKTEPLIEAIDAIYRPALGAHAEAFRRIRERIGAEGVPIHIAADVEQIICEIGGDWGTES